MFGVHNKKKSDIINGKTYKTIEDAIEYESNTFNFNTSQIFTHGPRFRRKNKIDYKKVKKVCSENDIKLFVHGSYPTIGLWSILDYPEKLETNINHIIDSMLSCIKLNASGLVIHLSKKPLIVIKDCFKILEDHILEHKESKQLLKCQILLESPAMAPTKHTFETPEKLNNLCYDIKNSKLKWGLCIDTAHLWCGGIELNNNLAWNEWLNSLTKFTKNKIKLYHLNGALKSSFKTGKDTHIIPFSNEDAIWNRFLSKEVKSLLSEQHPLNIEAIVNNITKKEINKIKNSSFYNIITQSKKHNIPIIFEINRGTDIDVKFCMALTSYLFKN